MCEIYKVKTKVYTNIQPGIFMEQNGYETLKCHVTYNIHMTQQYKTWNGT